MTTSRRAVLRSGGAATIGAIAGPFVQGMGKAHAAWPERPVRIVVPNTPGGPSDILARIVSPILDEACGGTFVIENKGGGGGNIGIGSVARAEPDGHTLLLCTSSIVVNPALYGDKLPYDPFADFAPARTPPEIVQKLSKACLEGCVRPDARDKLVKAGFDVEPKGPDGLKARLAKEIPMFKDIVAKAGIKASDRG